MGDSCARHPGLNGEQHAGAQDQQWDDALERARWQDQEQDRAAQPAKDRGNAEWYRPRTLTGQLCPIADRATDRARHEPDRVGHVGHDRRVAEGEQGWVGDQ